MSHRTISPGDLGRRITYHRKKLGLTREELAKRAGMTCGFVEYLEESAATLTEETLLRIASALGTTATELLGAGMDRPPGRGRASARPVLRTLDRDECLRLIGPGGVGRVAFCGATGPTVFPVNYSVHEGAIFFRTRYGGRLDEDLQTDIESAESTVGFEVDHIDEASKEGWDVLVQGPAHHVSPEDVAGLPAPGVEPWAGDDRELFIRITPQRITGRRITGF